MLQLSLRFCICHGFLKARNHAFYLSSLFVIHTDGLQQHHKFQGIMFAFYYSNSEFEGQIELLVHA